MSRAAPAGRTRQKQRTRRQILEAAAALIASGAQPTVTEAADAAGVSRRTAYRYFPSQVKLLGEASLETLRPLIEGSIQNLPAGESDAEMEARVVAFVRMMQKGTIRHEALLRTMIHATVLEPMRGGPKRGTRRVEWVEMTVAPLRRRLTPAAFRRLVSGLALCVGTEAMIVFRDVCAMTGPQAVAASEWLAVSLLRRALDEAGRKS